MNTDEYAALKAALEHKGGRVKWPVQARGVEMRKFRRKILKRVKDGRYKVLKDKIYYRIKFGKTISPEDAKGNYLKKIGCNFLLCC